MPRQTRPISNVTTADHPPPCERKSVTKNQPAKVACATSIGKRNDLRATSAATYQASTSSSLPTWKPCRSEELLDVVQPNHFHTAVRKATKAISATNANTPA